MALPFVFTDRHAYPKLAQYFNDTAQLTEIDWPLLQARNFQRNPDDPVQIERYQAEALIHRHMPVEALLWIVCYTDPVRDALQDAARRLGIDLNVQVMKSWYFQ